MQAVPIHLKYTRDEWKRVSEKNYRNLKEELLLEAVFEEGPVEF